MSYRTARCRLSIFSLLPSSRQTRNSGVTDFLIGTAGTRAATGCSAVTVPTVRRASNTLPISAGSSLAATLWLPACEATIFVVRLSSSGSLLPSSIWCLSVCKVGSVDPDNLRVHGAQVMAWLAGAARPCPSDACMIVPSPQWASPIHDAPGRIVGRSRPCTQASAHVGMPGTGVHAIRRQGELQPAGNVDRDQGGDVGDAVGGATDIGIRRQALLELLEEARDTRSPAL